MIVVSGDVSLIPAMSSTISKSSLHSELKNNYTPRDQAIDDFGITRNSHHNNKIYLNMDDINGTNNIKDEVAGEDWQKKAEEYLNGWKRAQADFINFKKDETKRLTEFLKFANEGLILEIIEVLDDLDSAAKELNTSTSSTVLTTSPLSTGLNQVIKKFQELLKKYGVERIKVKEEKFDPLVHEAISTESDGTKLEEVRAGYMMQDKVIRPARVKIVKE